MPLLKSYGINIDACKKVAISPIPPVLLEKMKSYCGIKECYTNCWRIVTSCRNFDFDVFEDWDFHYVLGVKVIDCGYPVQHAFIRVGEYYYDPTGQLFTDTDGVYFVAKEFTSDETREYGLEHSLAPDFENLINNGYADEAINIKYAIEIKETLMAGQQLMGAT